MKKKIIYGLLFAVALVTASSSFVSCKDYEGDDAARFDEQVYSIEDLLAKQQIALQNCSTNCATQHSLLWAEFEKYQLKGDYATNAKVKADSTVLATAIKQNANAILIIQNALDNYVTKAKFTTDSTEFMRLINANTLAIKAAQALAQNAIDLAKDDSIRIDGLESNYTTLNSNFEKFYKAWGNDLDAAVTEAARVRALADTVSLKKEIWNKAAIDAKQALADAKMANDTLNFYKLTWNTTADIVEANKAKWTAAADTVSKYEAAWIKAVLVADSAWNFVKGTKFQNLNELIAAYEKADKALQDQIDDLKKDVDNIKKFLTQEVTGIEIQGTYNPVFGYFALPVGVQSNVLATYFGNFDAAVEFPAGSASELWVGGVVKAYDGELPSVKGGKFTAGPGLVMNEEEGNAGNLYLTINPSNVDFDGANVKLFTTDNKQSYVTLSNLTASATQLKWGATRAGSANGFYQAKATISKQNVANTALKFDLNSAKAAAKDVVNNWRHPSNIDQGKLFDAVYKNLKQDLPRLGVQYNWEDVITGKQKIYASKYDVAAVSVKPFGFDLFYDKQDILSKYVTKVQNKVTGKIHAVENELEGLLKFNLGLGNIDPISINITPSADKLKYDVVAKADKNIPTSAVVEGLDEMVNELNKLKTDPTVHVGTIEIRYWYKERTYNETTKEWGDWGPEIGGTDGKESLPESDKNTMVQVTRMGVKTPTVTVKYNIADFETPTVVFGDYINKGDTIATATIDLSSLFNEMQTQVNGSIGTLNTTLTQINGLQGKIDSKLNQIASAISSYANRIESISNRVFNYAYKLVWNPNRYFQPALFASDSKSTLKLSSVKELPTVVEQGATIALFPTTMTTEIGVPAFKKYIAVTQVYNGTQADADALNAQDNINQVLEGAAFNVSSPLYFKVDAPQGSTIEILYEALGYNGKVAGKKFYIQVK